MLLSVNKQSFFATDGMSGQGNLLHTDVGLVDDLYQLERKQCSISGYLAAVHYVSLKFFQPQ